MDMIELEDTEVEELSDNLVVEGLEELENVWDTGKLLELGITGNS